MGERREATNIKAKLMNIFKLTLYILASVIIIAIGFTDPSGLTVITSLAIGMSFGSFLISERWKHAAAELMKHNLTEKGKSNV